MEFQVTVVKNGLRGATGKSRSGIAKKLAGEKGWVLADAQQQTPKRTEKLVRSEKATSDANSIRLTAGGGEVDYALHVHNGTYKMAAQPFLRDAAEAAVPRIAEGVGQAIAESLQ